MKVFVIFGVIEFIEDIAYVQETKHAAFMQTDEIEAEAIRRGDDWLTPHYYGGEVIFQKYHKEEWK